MSTFGKITLSFGETGKPDEEPVSFTARPVNLIVGPNNAGKSLFLRELSGTNPRRYQSDRSFTRKLRRIWNHKLDVETSLIVAEVAWPDDEIAANRRAIIAEALAEGTGKKKWPPGIPLQPWDKLIPALERVAESLDSHGANLAQRLVKIVATSAPEELTDLSNLVGLIDDDPPLSMMLGLGVVLLILGKHRAKSTPPEGRQGALPPDTDEKPSSEDAKASLARTAPLEMLEDALRDYWSHSLAAVKELGIEPPSPSFDDLTDPGLVAGEFIPKLQDNAFFAALLREAFKDDLSTIPSRTLPGFDYALALAQSFAAPESFRELSKTLQAAEEQLGWSHRDTRKRRGRDHLYLDGLTRLTMTDDGGLGPFDDDSDDDPPIVALLKSEENREQLRAVVAEVLGSQLVIDMVTSTPAVKWRLARNSPPERLEASYDQASRDFMAEAIPLEQRSDGIHALIGMFAAILAKNPSVVFIDEPEAFLHPPLIRRFASVIGRIACERNMQMFIATHSPDLIAGFAPQAHNMNILRLSYDERGSTPVAAARLLRPNALRRLALDPLLRSESTLAALFADGAVVCEAPADRTLYQEVNMRLLSYGSPGDGIESCAFLNAQNWQTVGNMIRPLREMGVAAAAVVDADVLFDRDLSKVLLAAQIPDAIRGGIALARAQFRDSLRDRIAKEQTPNNDDCKKTKLKHNVIAGLTSKEREIFEHLLMDLARYGVFLVPLGELESWLGPLGLQPLDDKSKWFKQALDRLGWDPDTPEYAKPETGDIWDFMRQVNAWILDPHRKGTAPPA